MALSTSLFSGITGLRAHNTMLDVIANNIANINTTGYKKSRVNFASSISQSSGGAVGPRTGAGFGGINSTQIGLGVSISSIDQIMSQGALQNTGNATDLAIDGAGMFAVRSGNQVVYTRAGDFTFDSAGNMVDRTGAIVQGWNVETEVTLVPIDGGLRDIFKSTYVSMDVTAANTGNIGNINIQPGFTMQPKATERIEVTGNLDAGGSTQNDITRQNPAALIDSSGPNPGGLPIFGPGGALISNQDLAFYGAGASDAWILDAAIPGGGAALNNVTDGNGDRMFENAVPDHSTGTVVYDSLGYEHQVTIWYFQTTDLSSSGAPPPGAGFNAATYAWYAFDTTYAPPTAENILGGTNIQEMFDSGDGLNKIGQYLVFNPDGSLQNQGSIEDGLTLEFKPTLYIRDLNNQIVTTTAPGNIFPAPLTNRIQSGAETFIKVTVDFGSAWPEATDDANDGPFGVNAPPIGPGKVMGAAARDGLTGDSTGILETSGNYLPKNTAAITFTDGFREGELLDLGVLSDGTIQGAFSNGQFVDLARVALAKFSNPGGLVKVGASHYALSANSGNAIMDGAGKNGRGAIQAGFLEQSNVDLAEELTSLIIAQRGFEVNSRVISTANSLLNTLVTLGQ